MAPRKKPEPGKELTPAAAQALAASRLDHLASHAGAGMERVGIQDVILPRLKILQALSPEVQRKKAEYVPGAEPGLILNVATLQLFESITVVPAAYIRHHIEWKPNRGGFVRDHGDNERVMERVKFRDDKSFDILDNGNIIQPTPTWYVIMLAGKRITMNGDKRVVTPVNLGGDQGIIAMPRTQARPSRSWMAQATSEKIEHPTEGQFQAPLFYRSWDLTTAETSNDEGDWSIWSVTPSVSVIDTDPKTGDLLLPEDTMPKAVRFRDLVTSGAVRATAEHFTDDAPGSGQGGGQQQGGNEDRPM